MCRKIVALLPADTPAPAIAMEVPPVEMLTIPPPSAMYLSKDAQKR